MNKYKWCIEVGFAGCIHSGEWEFEEEPTEDELKECMNDEMMNYIACSYCEVEKNEQN